MDAQTFFQTYAPYAIAEQKRSGIPASITLSQAALESGYGGSGLVTKALNFFGIKAYGGWSGATYFTPTTEVVNGVPRVELASFRKYTSAGESFADHSDFLKDNKRYAPALAAAGDPLKMADQLQAAGYATDPNYGSKLKSIITSHELTKYDVPGAIAPTPTQGDVKTTVNPFTNPQQFLTDFAQNSLIGLAIIVVLVATGFIGYQAITNKG